MKIISEDNKSYGINRLKHKIHYYEKRIHPLQELFDNGNISIYGAEQLGRLKEAKDICEDLLDEWNEVDL